MKMNPPPVMHDARSRWLETLDDRFFEENQETLSHEAERRKRDQRKDHRPEPES